MLPGSRSRPRAIVARAASRSPARICASASEASTATSVGSVRSARRSQSTAAGASFSRSDSAAMRVARCDELGVVGDQRAVVDERLPRRVEVVLPLGGRRVEKERRRIDRERVRSPAAACARRRPRWPSRSSARPYSVRISLVGAGLDADALERLERLAERDAVVARLGDVEPDLAERAVDRAADRACARARCRA